MQKYTEYALWSGKNKNGQDVAIVHCGRSTGTEFVFLGRTGIDNWDWFNDKGKSAFDRRHDLVNFPENFDDYLKEKFLGKQALKEQVQALVAKRLINAQPKTITPEERQLLEKLLDIAS